MAGTTDSISLIGIGLIFILLGMLFPPMEILGASFFTLQVSLAAIGSFAVLAEVIILAKGK